MSDAEEAQTDEVQIDEHGQRWHVKRTPTSLSIELLGVPTHWPYTYGGCKVAVWSSVTELP